MAADTFRVIWGQVLLRCPLAGPLLAQSWTQNAFRRLAEKRLWSWLHGSGEFLFPALINAGTVTVTLNSNQVVGDATASAAWTAAVVGRQFRISTLTPIFTITAFDGVSTLTLDQVWGTATAATQGYSIFQSYQTTPADFLRFTSVVDPQRNWQLWANRWKQSDLNTWDAQRAAAGNTYAVVFRDFDPTGITSPPQARFEFWPAPQTQYMFPYLYVKRPTDISDPGATLPYTIRGDVILEGALSDAARWPGPPGQANPYFSPALANQHEGRFQLLAGELEKQDDELYEQDIEYQMFTAGLPWAPFPGDSRFIQSHLLPSLYGTGLY